MWVRVRLGLGDVITHLSLGSLCSDCYCWVLKDVPQLYVRTSIVRGKLLVLVLVLVLVLDLALTLTLILMLALVLMLLLDWWVTECE